MNTKKYLENTVKKNKNLKYIVVRNDINFHHIRPTANELAEDNKFLEKIK